MTSHSRSNGEELQRSILVQIASAIGDLESAMGIAMEVGGLAAVIRQHEVDHLKGKLLIGHPLPATKTGINNKSSKTENAVSKPASF